MVSPFKTLPPDVLEQIRQYRSDRLQPHPIADLLHDKSKLSQWMETVPDFQEYETGSEAKKAKVPR